MKWVTIATQTVTIKSEKCDFVEAGNAYRYSAAWDGAVFSSTTAQGLREGGLLTAEAVPRSVIFQTPRMRETKKKEDLFRCVALQILLLLE